MTTRSKTGSKAKPYICLFLDGSRKTIDADNLPGAQRLSGNECVVFVKKGSVFSHRKPGNFTGQKFNEIREKLKTGTMCSVEVGPFYFPKIKYLDQVVSMGLLAFRDKNRLIWISTEHAYIKI